MTERAAGAPGQDAGAPIPVSVLIAARDEERQLPGALAEVAGWAGEVVVVVDPRTRDRTREIAGDRGARVLEHSFDSSADQLRWGMTQCRYDWVFVLDADERVTGELRASVGRAVTHPRHPAYAVRRRNLAFGRVLRFGDWGGDRVVRLVDRRGVELAGGMHWRVAAATTGRLHGLIVHDTLRCLDQYLPKLVDYARRGAGEVAARRAGGLNVAVRPLWRFLRAYVLRLGFLDGVPGFVVAALSATGTFLKWASVWEGRATAGPRHS